MRNVFLTAVALFVAFAASGCDYNSLTAKQQNVRGKWANVENQLQRRSDLIPNLFEAAKASGVQEQEVFGRIADARAALTRTTGAQPQGANGDKSPEQKQEVLAANSALSRLLVQVENYPVLQSNQLFQNFQVELTGTENRVATARGDYNTAVQDYNTSIKQFPGVLTASAFGFKEEPQFQAEEGARQAPRINANDLRQNQNPPAGGAPR